MLLKTSYKYKNASGWSMAIVIFTAVFLAGVAAFNLYLGSLPPIKQLQKYQPNHVSQFVSRDGKIIKTYGSFKFNKTSNTEIPDILKKAIIATEDKNFYKHRGFDASALLRSVIKNVIAGKVVQGASTVTQQLARILFLSTERTYDRKIKELILSHRLEKSLTKEEILGMYLNNVYLGEGAYGASAAAEVYFNKKLDELTVGETALIAGLPQAPSVYSPYQNMTLATQRRAQVLTRMEKMGYLTKELAETIKKEPIVVREDYKPFTTNKAPYFVDFALRELQEAGITEQEISQGGYKIYTTLDYDAHIAAQESIKANMKGWHLTEKDQQAALFSFDTVTGRIVAYVGGKDYSSSQFDRVTQAVRQPGSSFKVFVYTSAIEHGLNPNDLYDDLPIIIGRWSPRNYGSKYRKKLPLHTALALSSNVVAVRLIMDVGVDETTKLARRLGLTTPIASDPTIALGSSGVKLYEITNAYGALANGGIKVKPYAVEKVVTPRGKVIYSAEQSYSRVMDIDTVANVVSMLKEVVEKGTGRAANIGRPAAGKTGTTDSYKDAWFIGFTPEIVTGVWVGNDDNTSNGHVTGGSVPAVIWRDYMKKAMKPHPVSDFDYPQITIDHYDLPDAIKIEEDMIYDEDTGQVVNVEEQADEILSKFGNEYDFEDEDYEETNENFQTINKKEEQQKKTTNSFESIKKESKPTTYKHPRPKMPPPRPPIPIRPKAFGATAY